MNNIKEWQRQVCELDDELAKNHNKYDNNKITLSEYIGNADGILDKQLILNSKISKERLKQYREDK